MIPIGLIIAVRFAALPPADSPVPKWAQVGAPPVIVDVVGPMERNRLALWAEFKMHDPGWAACDGKCYGQMHGTLLDVAEFQRRN